MKTGRQTLGDIEEAIGELATEENRIDGALRSAGAKAEQLRQDRATALRELARVKLDEMTAGRLVRDLDAAERRAMQILEEGQHRLEAIAQRKADTIAEVEQAETQRHAAAAEVEAAVEALENLRADVEAKVRATAPWKAAQSAFQAIEQIAAEAEKKAAASEAELGEKKKPYDADSLFTYLWERGFGTAHYSAGNFARMMDRMVADHIGYLETRANYAMLIEIPLRLREHAKGRRVTADEARGRVAEFERTAMVAAGSDAMEKVLAATRHRLASAEQALEAKHAALRDVEARHTRLIDGGPESAYASAIDTMASADSTDDITTLLREARRTATPADEALVRRIEKIDDALAAIEKEIGELRRSAKALADRRSGIENVRDRFRNAGYDHPHATFGNDNEIVRALQELLSGAVRSGLVWDLIRAGFRSRAMRGRPDFGSPNFPFPFPIPGGGPGPRGGGWREPSTQGGWSPPHDSSSSSGGGGSSKSSDDSFSTGGSF